MHYIYRITAYYYNIINMLYFLSRVYVVAEEDERPAWNDGDFFGDKFGQ